MLDEYKRWIDSTRAMAVVAKRAPPSAHAATIDVGYYITRALRNVYDRKLPRDHELIDDELLPWEK